MIKAAISGAAGRMGKTILAVIGETDGIATGAAIEQPGSPALGLDAGEQAGSGRLGVSITADLESVMDDFDVLIDFTRADAVLQNLARCRAGGKKVVIAPPACLPINNRHYARQARRSPSYSPPT